jgi:hypothetical protein
MPVHATTPGGRILCNPKVKKPYAIGALVTCRKCKRIMRVSAAFTKLTRLEECSPVELSSLELISKLRDSFTKGE